MGKDFIDFEEAGLLRTRMIWRENGLETEGPGF